MTAERCLSFDPLRDEAVKRVSDNYWPNRRNDGRRSMATVLAVPEYRIRRIWEPKGLTTQEADKAAVTLGLHPSAIWPEWFALPTTDEAEPPTFLPLTDPCCECRTCGPCDELADGGCRPYCLPCSFGVCACPVEVPA